MSDNEENKPTEPQDPDVSLRDRRRILEELTPNVTAKQLSEQLARMKREAENDGEDDSTDSVDMNTTAENNALNKALGAAPKPTEANQTNPQSEGKPEQPKAQTAVSESSMTEEPRLSTMETRAVVYSSEPTPEPEQSQPAPVTDTKTNIPATQGRDAQSDGEEKSIKIALTSEKPESPTETAVLNDDKSQRPAQSTLSSTSKLPDSKKFGNSGENASSEVGESDDNVDASPNDDNPDDKSELDDLEDSLNKELSNKHDTAILANKPQVRRALQQHATTEHQTASLGENREIILVIRGMVERLILPDDKRIILGRTDVKSRFLPDVDLTPYGALDRGVSREHASLHLQGDRLFVTDLNSTNGTYLAGKKLDPHTPSVLRKGDELLLGRLPVQVLFR